MRICSMPRHNNRDLIMIISAQQPNNTPAQYENTKQTAVNRKVHHAFTISELIVAIAVTLVLILATGRIFTMTQTTISLGQASAELSQAGRTLERLLQKDLDSITRDGFLVIRNERLGAQANGNVNRRLVYLNKELEKLDADSGNYENNLGIVRLDQLIFIGSGQYSTYQFRESGISDGTIARNDTSANARILWGHLLRTPDLYNPTGDPFPPGDPLGSPEIKNGFGPNGYRAIFADDASSDADTVNKYAQDWILGRQAALLLPRDLVSQDWQLSFAPSIFELFNEAGGYFENSDYFDDPGAPLNDYTDYGTLKRRLSAGYVDIINMDLADVESAITEYGFANNQSNNGARDQYTDPIGQSYSNVRYWLQNAQPFAESASGMSNGFFQYLTATEDKEQIGQDLSEQWLLGQWLRLAMTSGRIRGESVPPSTSRLDQMLTHATAFPSCSNFEIAWSTGQVEYPSGDIMWYDIDQPANPYIPVTGQSSQERRERAPDNPLIWYMSELSPQMLVSNMVWPQNGPVAEDTRQDLYYGLFGYFTPRLRDGFTDVPDEDREDRTQAWPWPKMLRVRATIHDRSGHLPAGRTFEYIFTLPE